MSDQMQAMVDPALAGLGWALVHFLWQGVVIAATLEIALACAGARNARVRYFLCGVALVAMPICFAVTFWNLVHETRVAVFPIGAMAEAAASAPGIVPTPAESGLPSDAQAPTDFVARAFPAWDWNRVMQGLAAVWLGGVVLLSGRKAGGMVVVWRWRRRGIADADEGMVEMFERACETIGVDPQRVGLKISELVRVPMTMGWWRPMVLFPACLLSGLSAGEIELLLAHELAHIRRWDYLVNLGQAVIETLFFYHPLTWWISRRMRQERENCCDDLVARSPGETLAYAKVLLRLETMRTPGRELVAAASGGVLRQRIERLLGDPAPGLAGGFSILLVAVLFGVVAACSFVRAQAAVAPKAAPAVVVTETKEMVGDVGRLYHAMVYAQKSAEPPKEVSWQFIADLSNNTFPVTGGTVSLPQGSAWATNPVAVVKPDLLVGAHYLYVQGFKSEAELMANFPNGGYTFNIQPGAPGAAYAAPVSFSGSVAYPPQAPVITNTTWDAGALVLDPTSAVINYTNYPGATLTWEIVIPGDHYIMSAGGGGTAIGSLNLTGMLSYGQTYVAQLRFINRDKSSTVSDPNSPKDYGYSTMMARIVEFTIKTPAGHASAAPAAPAPGASTNRVAATVDGHAITTEELEEAWQSSENNLRANYDGAELKDKLGAMRKKVLEKLVDRQLIIEDFKRAGGFIPKSFIDERVNDEITNNFGGDRAAFLKARGERGETLDQIKEEMEDNAIVGYMRNKNVVEKVWVYYQGHIDQFPQDDQANVTVLEIEGGHAVPPGHAGDFSAESDPGSAAATEARRDLRNLKAGNDVSQFDPEQYAPPPGGGIKFTGWPIWVTKDNPYASVPGWWPFQWSDIEKLKPGETSKIVVTDFIHSHGDGPEENRHAYWILRVNARRPATVAATPETAKHEKALIDAEADRLQEAWLGPLRAKAKVQILDPSLAIDSWATEPPRAKGL